MTYHCGKLCDLLDEHAVRVLPWILERANSGDEFAAFEVTSRSAKHAALWDAVHDPAKLAELLAELLQNKFGASVVIVAPNRSLHRTPSRLDFVVYWDNDYGGTIQIKPPCGHNDVDMSKVFVMPQARALMLKWLQLPDASSRKQCEWLTRGET